MPLNPEQSMKAQIPIDVSELGNVRSPVNPEHLLNALFPIVVMELGNVKVPLNPEHFSKVDSSTVFNE